MMRGTIILTSSGMMRGKDTPSPSKLAQKLLGSLIANLKTTSSKTMLCWLFLPLILQLLFTQLMQKELNQLFEEEKQLC